MTSRNSLSSQNRNIRLVTESWIEKAYETFSTFAHTEDYRVAGVFFHQTDPLYGQV